jgi:hypothetical protein
MLTVTVFLLVKTTVRIAVTQTSLMLMMME